MKRCILVLLCFLTVLATPASADWRWSAPKLHKQTATYHCNTFKCLKHSYLREHRRLKHRVDRYNAHRLAEWKKWVSTPIANCSWGGESSPPGDFSRQFARYRYTVRNGEGSDAYGKYQMMPGTYSSYAKYYDWSPLDQEIAGHKLYAAQGTSPWQACG